VAKPVKHLELPVQKPRNIEGAWSIGDESPQNEPLSVEGTWSIGDGALQNEPLNDESTMIFCGNCGVKNPKDKKFCWKCGQSLYQSSSR
jgi:hypothetical protein